jgi:hypothetical protein
MGKCSFQCDYWNHGCNLWEEEDEEEHADLEEDSFLPFKDIIYGVYYILYYTV